MVGTLMVITDLDIVCIAFDKPEAYAPLIIDGDGMLPFSVAPESVKPIAGRYLQVVQPNGEIQILQLSSCSSGDFRRKPLGPSGGVQILGTSVPERLDHRRTVLCHVTHVKAPVTCRTQFHGTQFHEPNCMDTHSFMHPDARKVGVQGFKELGPCSLVPGFSPGFSFGIEWGVGVPGFCLEHRQQVVDENCFVHGAVDSVKNRCCAVSASLKSLPKSWCP